MTGQHDLLDRFMGVFEVDVAMGLRILVTADCASKEVLARFAFRRHRARTGRAVAMKERNLSAIRRANAVAVKHELVIPPPETPERGGVLIVRRRLTEASWAALFTKQGANDGPEDKTKQQKPKPSL